MIQSEGTTWCKVHMETPLALVLRVRFYSNLWPEGRCHPASLHKGCWQAATKLQLQKILFFPCPFSIHHATVKKGLLQTFRGSPSPCYICCQEDFKLQREWIKVVLFGGMMAGSRDSRVIYCFLCWDTTACLCHAVARLSHIFKWADFLSLLGKEI